MKDVAATSDLHAYYRSLHRRRLALAAIGLIALLSFLLDLGTGSMTVPVKQVIACIVGDVGCPPDIALIVREVRLPVALMALLAGCALALAGAEMQTVLDNPLAEPFTLGVSTSAALGASLAIIGGVALGGITPTWAVPINAFLFALLSLLLLQALAALTRSGPSTLILFGIAIGLSAGALLSLIQFFASADALQQLFFWSMGSLARANWTTVAILALAVSLTAPLSLAQAWRMMAMRFGDDQARSFGIDVGRLRMFALVRISIVAGATVAFVGVIGFVGLVAPHIARMTVGGDHRFFLPASLLIGATLMSLASVASKTLVPGLALPIGIVTSLVGLPLFFGLIVRQHRKVR